ncbi:MAG TPA: DegV family protein [Trueperaceae bacterium]
MNDGPTKLAIVTDSTCDLNAETLQSLNVARVPLSVHFQGKTYKDWLEITPRQIIEGVQAGAGTPTTSQPSPQDFETAYRDTIAAGAEEILCLTLSSEISGTYQSATLAAASAEVPVTVFDSRAASLGLGGMVIEASRMRAAGFSLADILQAIEHIRDSNYALFTVAGLEFLQKGGRIGRASALLGSLLNIKPLLAFQDGRIEPVGRARGAKKALRELVNQLRAYQSSHPGRLIAYFIHVEDEAATETLRREMEAAGLEFENAGTYEIGAVIASHAGPGTYGVYVHTKPK